MTYIEGFITPVATAKKDEYRQYAADTAPLFKEFGVTRFVENWGDDLPEGKVTDFAKSVQAKDGETVVFSWFEYPDKATRDAANAKMMADPRIQQFVETMPFDGKRMILGGFDSIVDQKGDGSVGYTDGYILPVPEGNKAQYREIAEEMAGKFKEKGAVRVLEGWGDDVPDGKVTDFRKAVKAEEGENVVYSYVQWPDKATRDQAWNELMSDPTMQNPQMPFDGKRMFWGGFEPILDTSAE